MPETRRKYDPPFREGAVRIVRETGKPIAEVARDLGIHAGTLGSWVNNDRRARGDKPDATKADPDYVRQLERENAELRMERDVLKRSVGPVGQGGDAMSVASFVAAQRTDHGVPTPCPVGLSTSRSRGSTSGGTGPRHLGTSAGYNSTAAVRTSEDSDGDYGSPRVLADLRDWGWKVSKTSVEASMARQSLAARPKRRFRSLTRADKAAPPAPDLLRRDFSAQAVNDKWSGDLTEIPPPRESCTWRASRTWPAAGWRVPDNILVAEIELNGALVWGATGPIAV